MRTITLSKGLACLIDDDDYELISQWKWYAHGPSDRPYACRRPYNKAPLVYMHRVINKTQDGLFTDHIDGDTLNNTKENLRAATALQNMMNGAKKRNGTSKHKGVWLDNSRTSSNNWRSAIRIEGRLHYLGRFATEEEAGAAYASCAKKSFGDFNRSEKGDAP